MPEPELCASETDCRAILQSIADALVFADTNGVIRDWNPGAEALFGFSAADALGRSLDLIIPENLRAAHWEGYRLALSRGGTVHGRRSTITRALHKSGRQLYVDMSFAVVRDQAGTTIGAVAVASDATQRHLEQKELRRQLAERKAGLAP